MVQLANAHMTYRIYVLCQRGVVERATSYRRLKQQLNEFMTFKDFLAQMCTDWAPVSEDIEQDDGVATGNMNVGGDDECVVVDGLKKRYRFEFYQGTKGTQHRRSQVNHQRLSGVQPPRRCIVCSMKTTVKCKACDVHLCGTKFGSNKKSCFDFFHDTTKVNLHHFSTLSV